MNFHYQVRFCEYPVRHKNAKINCFIVKPGKFAWTSQVRASLFYASSDIKGFLITLAMWSTFMELKIFLKSLLEQKESSTGSLF